MWLEAVARIMMIDRNYRRMSEVFPHNLHSLLHARLRLKSFHWITPSVTFIKIANQLSGTSLLSHIYMKHPRTTPKDSIPKDLS